MVAAPPQPFVDPRFENFRFAGPLRKGRESPRRPVPKDIPAPVYVNNPMGRDARETDQKRGKQIPIYNATSVAIMREACKLGREVLDEAHKVG